MYNFFCCVRKNIDGDENCKEDENNCKEDVNSYKEYENNCKEDNEKNNKQTNSINNIGFKYSFNSDINIYKINNTFLNYKKYHVLFKDSIYSEILKYNKGQVGIWEKCKINIFNRNNLLLESIFIKKIIGKGTYNTVYEGYKKNEEGKIAISVNNYKNPVKKNIDDFLSSIKIQRIINNCSLNCAPIIYNFFFLKKNEKIYLCNVSEKCKIDAFDYLKIYRSDGEWLNYIIQICYKLYYLQNKFKFTHNDLKPNNTMGKIVECKNINYNSSYIMNSEYEFDFDFCNYGINWIIIDFGFSNIQTETEYIHSKEFIENDIEFNDERDLTLLFYIIINYFKLPYIIKNLIENCLSNVKIKETVFYPGKLNIPLDEIYMYLHSNEFKNDKCKPGKILHDIYNQL